MSRKTVVAALDFSETTELVVEHAVRLAEAFDAEIVLIHIAAPEPDFVGYSVGPETVRDARAQVLRKEHTELQQRTETLRERGLAARALLVEGPTIDKLLEECRRLDPLAIVVGSHGHGAIHRALLGSVSEAIVRGAQWPVHVVPKAMLGAGD